MHVQLTDYGVSQLASGVIPLVIAKYEIGTGYAYTPSMTATGLKGELLYSGTPTEPIVIDGNTSKYIIALGYTLGDFTFGEIAMYDSNNQCVATAVSDTPITKQKYSSSKYGNSLVLDIYISSTGRNYYAWVDELTSSNEFGIPVLQSIDALPTPGESVPNFYIISPASSNATSVLAYCTNKGIWNFDCYQYDGTKQFTITGGSFNSIVFDRDSLSASDLELLSSQYYGDAIVQFGASNLAGTCRTVNKTVISGDTVTVTFKTPLNIVPNAGDKVMVFNRSASSVSDSVLPVATKDTLGGVVVGVGLDITPEGVLSINQQAISAPVTSVNGQVGEVILRIENIEGASKVAQSGSYKDLLDKPASVDSPSQVEQAQDISTIVTPGIYAGDGSEVSLANGYPIDSSDTPFVLEVTTTKDENGEVVGAIQRFNNGETLAFRAYDGENWSAWVQVATTTKLPIASATVLGAIKLGAGLVGTSDGVVSTSVTSVFGRTGDVVLAQNDVLSVLTPLYNVAGGLASLTTLAGNTDQEKYESARITERNLTFGALYMPQGTWNASTNALNGDSSYKLMPGGKIMYKESATKYTEVACKGWVIEVGVAGTTELDGESSWEFGELLFSNGSSWKKFANNSKKIVFPTESGVLGYNATTGLLHNVKFNSETLDITSSTEGDLISLELKSQSAVTPGDYSTVTVNEKGIVVSASKGIFGGHF